jgi:hypothetical protein
MPSPTFAYSSGAMLLLLLVNVRNAWDLTVTFARRHSDSQHNS